MANLLVKINFQRSTFASRKHARAFRLTACLTRQDHVYITAYQSFHFRNNSFDEMRCKLDFTENPCSFEKIPTTPAPEAFRGGF